MNRQRLLRRLRQGHLANVRFDDLVDLANGFGLREQRVVGSHRIFAHPDHGERAISLQPRRGEAKPYQIRQLLAFVERYDLNLEAE
ncbi:MAG: type II toxin-antitoxin system HicA family toxin [Chloroflexi bacterium]|nr:type II toxin-antitoxin system HicA family toxin [Chloroflexota bacterium]MDA1002261.1 type II toxin-antitoxin system HicA family toxin [Chloroflexota bacterium]